MKFLIFLIVYLFNCPLMAHGTRYCTIQKLNNVYEIGLSNEFMHGDLVINRWERGKRLSSKGEIYTSDLLQTSHAAVLGQVFMLEYTKQSKLFIQNILRNHFIKIPPFIRYSKLPHYIITVHLESPLPPSSVTLFKKIDDTLFPEGIHHNSIFTFECVDV